VPAPHPTLDLRSRAGPHSSTTCAARLVRYTNIITSAGCHLPRGRVSLHSRLLLPVARSRRPSFALATRLDRPILSAPCYALITTSHRRSLPIELSSLVPTSSFHAIPLSHPKSIRFRIRPAVSHLLSRLFSCTTLSPDGRSQRSPIRLAPQVMVIPKRSWQSRRHRCAHHPAPAPVAKPISPSLPPYFSPNIPTLRPIDRGAQ